MATKKFTIDVTADTDAKCTEKVKAALEILKAIPHQDLLDLAEIAKKKPHFVQKAKPYVGYL